VYPLIERGEVDTEVGRYLNRLSDFLFACVRASAMREGREELLWRKAAPFPEDIAAAAAAAASTDKVAKSTV
jgi:hypothetical protein